MLARKGYVRCFAWLCGPRSWMLALLVLGFLVSLGRPCFGQGRTLSVIINGNGTVRGEGGLIDCPPTCSTGPFGDGRPITLTATQGEGFRFAEWGGACRGTIDRCTVLMTQDQSVTATFRVIPPGSPLVLTVRVEGNAIRSGGPTSLKTSSPPGMRCPDDCSEVYGRGPKVILTAAHPHPKIRTSWDGACNGSGPCTVNMTADRTPIAIFDIGDVARTLDVKVSGRGRVTSSLVALNCLGACSCSGDCS